MNIEQTFQKRFYQDNCSSVHNENDDHIWPSCTSSLTRGLCYATHVLRYILLANICNKYARQSLQHIWSVTFYWIFWLFGTNELKLTHHVFRRLVRRIMCKIITSRKHAYIILTRLNPTFI